jgi:hypothetical protein
VETKRVRILAVAALTLVLALAALGVLLACALGLGSIAGIASRVDLNIQFIAPK